MGDLRASLIHALQMERLRDHSFTVGTEGKHPINRWWLGAALMALHTNRFHLITNRAGTALYMLRCWLSVPRISPERVKHGAVDGEQFESGESQLLHWIVEPDDCSALHDHPWDFETEILEGGYGEYVNLPTSVTLGEDNFTAARTPGDHASKRADNLHAIGTLLAGSGRILPTGILGGAWTCVRTGPRFRRWGFHPPGAAWMDNKAYLGHKAKL